MPTPSQLINVSLCYHRTDTSHWQHTINLGLFVQSKSSMKKISTKDDYWLEREVWGNSSQRKTQELDSESDQIRGFCDSLRIYQRCPWCLALPVTLQRHLSSDAHSNSIRNECIYFTNEETGLEQIHFLPKVTQFVNKKLSLQIPVRLQYYMWKTWLAIPFVFRWENQDPRPWNHLPGVAEPIRADDGSGNA